MRRYITIVVSLKLSLRTLMLLVDTLRIALCLNVTFLFEVVNEEYGKGTLIGSCNFELHTKTACSAK